MNNFDDSHKPICLRLPAGRGRALRDAMDQLVEDVTHGLVTAFEREAYQQQRQQLEQETEQQPRESMEQLKKKAEQQGLMVVPTPQGIAVVPQKEDGSPMQPQELNKLSQQEQEQYREKSKALQQEVQDVLRQQPHEQREARRKVRWAWMSFDGV